ncbi:hypothetical protein LGM89_00865 [Burkholderia sp. AU31624]|uniref:hypothetical protein n=1 Tax=Burkholderia sp. AU31624 TaxID=2879629 RepID=UPI001CF41F78|nr:hypothetical protein [Burkholderia sp. AU31624]MCA8251802.1 hypothetical protein [Burkholderia sp. AU31624]
MKTLAGKRWFYSLGQRSMSPLYMGPWPYKDWPEWALIAYFTGQDDERFSRARQAIKTWSASKIMEQSA